MDEELAYDKIWRELHRDGHDNLLERPQVLCVTHCFSRPWNVDRAALSSKLWVDKEKKMGGLSKTGPFSSGFHASKLPIWVKSPLVIPVYGYVQYRRVVKEGQLSSVALKVSISLIRWIVRELIPW